ncbi:aldehyde dehydrogenase family protein [Kitasatospora sp. NPDC028055]|uniref:aldehyde dehydrogenase family protein n=1 Tax=Kitasatospora sp. NPDC028055 TaxID=3155653 RepID=UPI0033DDE0FE
MTDSTSDVRNPATGELLATVADTTAEQLDAAVQRAVKARTRCATSPRPRTSSSTPRSDGP